MRVNLYVASCSLLAYAANAMSLVATNPVDLMQSYSEDDYDLDLAETYGLDCKSCCGDGVSAGAIKALEAKIDALSKPCPEKT